MSINQHTMVATKPGQRIATPIPGGGASPAHTSKRACYYGSPRESIDGDDYLRGSFDGHLALPRSRSPEALADTVPEVAYPSCVLLLTSPYDLAQSKARARKSIPNGVR